MPSIKIQYYVKYVLSTTPSVSFLKISINELYKITIYVIKLLLKN